VSRSSRNLICLVVVFFRTLRIPHASSSCMLDLTIFLLFLWCHYSCRQVLGFLQQTVAMLGGSDTELAIKLFMQIAIASDNCGVVAKANGISSHSSFNSLAYELMAQAFLLYEDEISDSKAQLRILVTIIGTMLACGNFSKDDYEALITKTAQYGAKLLKKPDQCKMVTLCSHLFYTGEPDVSK
jgi:vacuolar protein sorting-associated protein 35